MRSITSLKFAAFAAMLLCSTRAPADPWAPPGDMALRHDLMILADREVLKGPVTTWPLSWPDVARDVVGYDPERTLDASVRASLIRVQRAARRVMARAGVAWQVSAAAAAEPQRLRAFGEVPREEGELQAGGSWTGERLALRLQTTAVSDPDDEKHVRFDGSYVGMNLGNFMISAGLMERWWGPGWEGSLILSNSARPIPTLTIERNYSDPFELPVLRWLGPWRATVSVGELEGSRSDFPRTRFLAARVTFKPVTQLELGLSRTAQWCGDGRPCDLDTFADLIVGADNDQAPTEQPGNQLAGYDGRWAFKSIPLALYAQLTGEDEAGGLPAKFLGLAGAEAWGSSRFGDWRIHAEYADTSCNFSRSQPDFNCGYESTIYTQGYRYRGRSIGHSMDSDGRMYSFGVVLVTGHDDEWHLLGRNVELNRDASTPEPAHSVSPLGAELTNLELLHVRNLAIGQVRVGIGYDDYKTRLDGGDDTILRGFVQLRRTW